MSIARSMRYQRPAAVKAKLQVLVVVGDATIGFKREHNDRERQTTALGTNLVLGRAP